MISPLPINWPQDGLIPAVIQDTTSGDVLMVGFMNETALSQTRATGFVHFWSRSRQKLWKKGETSGHVQRVENIFVNCEQNSLLIEVEQMGAVCHDGYPTCYYRRLEPDNSLVTTKSRWFDPADVYGGSDGLATTTARWWGAYEYLRQRDLTAESSTSRALRSDMSVMARIKDEIGELAGVMDGSHIHTNQHDDTVLEASQVLYWTAVETIRRGGSFDSVRPDRALDLSVDETEVSLPTVVNLLGTIADTLNDDAFTSDSAHQIFSHVAIACVSLGISPLEPIQRDLEELRRRDYLAPYFA